ncbi:MAG: hypothetical protein FWF12_00185 [Betaproteobacteria bacterium]|nr:hypothetical protein [Betaproteobacteria bacterium]
MSAAQKWWEIDEDWAYEAARQRRLEEEEQTPTGADRQDDVGRLPESAQACSFL